MPISKIRLPDEDIDILLKEKEDDIDAQQKIIEFQAMLAREDAFNNIKHLNSFSMEIIEKTLSENSATLKLNQEKTSALTKQVITIFSTLLSLYVTAVFVILSNKNFLSHWLYIILTIVALLCIYPIAHHIKSCIHLLRDKFRVGILDTAGAINNGADNRDGELRIALIEQKLIDEKEFYDTYLDTEAKILLSINFFPKAIIFMIIGILCIMPIKDKVVDVVLEYEKLSESVIDKKYHTNILEMHYFYSNKLAEANILALENRKKIIEASNIVDENSRKLIEANLKASDHNKNLELIKTEIAKNIQLSQKEKELLIILLNKTNK